jgi:hypothetical protein
MYLTIMKPVREAKARSRAAVPLKKKVRMWKEAVVSYPRNT